MPENIDPTHLIAGGAAAAVGAALVADAAFGDDDTSGTDDAVFDLDHFGGNGVADGDSSVAGDDVSDSYSEYMTEQADLEATSEMMETMHETNMEIIDNMDGSDDYYYEDVPGDGW